MRSMICARLSNASFGGLEKIKQIYLSPTKPEERRVAAAEINRSVLKRNEMITEKKHLGTLMLGDWFFLDLAQKPQSERWMAQMLLGDELNELLGITDLKQFDPNVHGRLAYKIFVVNAVEDTKNTMRLQTVIVQLTQFDGMTERDVADLFTAEERQELGLTDQFLRQFSNLTPEEVDADEVVTGGLLECTLVKVADKKRDFRRAHIIAALMISRWLTRAAALPGNGEFR